MNGREADRDFLGVGWGFPPRLDRSGEIVLARDEEDIRQSIWIILGTALGERVMRPDFGVGLKALVFEPVNTTTMAIVKRRVEEALITWEPRINVEEVRVNTDRSSRNKLLIGIDYRVRSTNTFYNLVYPFYLSEGERA